MDFKKRFQTRSRPKSKKGAALAEAALVYPIAILSLFLALALAVLLYRQGCIASTIHMSLREAGGRATGTIFEGEEPSFNSNGSNEAAEEPSFKDKEPGFNGKRTRSNSKGSHLGSKLFESFGVEEACKELVEQRLSQYLGTLDGTVTVGCNRLAIFPKLKVEENQKGKKLPILKNPMNIHMEGELELQDEAAFLRNKRLLTEGGHNVEQGKQ